MSGGFGADVATWVGTGVGAVGGVAAFFARRALTSMDDLHQSIAALKITMAVHVSELARINSELEDTRQRLTGTQLELAALRGKLDGLGG